MHEGEALGRREFTLQAALAVLSGVTITITGCGGGGYGRSDSATGPSQTSDLRGSVADNHGHAAAITAAQMMAGGTLRIDIRGAADHPHTLELSAVELTTLVSGATVAKRSGTGQSTAFAAHDHMVTFGSNSVPDPGY